MSEAVKNEFVVADDSSAEWCLRKIREAEKDRAMWKAHYESQMKKVDENADNTVSYFTAKLEEYFETVPHKATKTQESYVLPGGKLIRKQQQPKYEVDDTQVVAWLKENFLDEMIKVKETADWAALKKMVTCSPDGVHVITENGEIVPGVSVTERPDLFKVEMEGGI